MLITCTPWYNVIRRVHHLKPQSNHKKTERPKLKHVLQNNWSVPFKSLKVMEDKDPEAVGLEESK